MRKLKTTTDFSEKWRRRRLACACLFIAFCFLLSGDAYRAKAIVINNKELFEGKKKVVNYIDTPRKIVKSSAEFDKMFDALKNKCDSKSLLDRFKENPRSTNARYSSVENQAVYLVGTDACPGLDIPAGTNFVDTGTTLGANNTVSSIPLACNTLYTQTAGPDVIYRFVLPPLAQRTVTNCSISLDPTGASWDTSIYTLSDTGTGCPAGTGNGAANCVNGADGLGSNGTEVIGDAAIDAMPAGTYYLFIDSFYATGALSAGTYSLTFNCDTLNPVAAGVNIGGRIANATGIGINGTRVSMTKPSGEVVTIKTNAFGYYKFEDLEVGSAYTIQVTDKRYQFANPTQIITLEDAVEDLDFTALP